MAHPAKGPGGAWTMDDPGSPWWPWCSQAYDYQQLQAQRRFRDDPRRGVNGPPDAPTPPWPPGAVDARPFEHGGQQQQQFREQQRGPPRQGGGGDGGADPPGAPWGFPPPAARQYQHPAQYYDYERPCHPAEYDQQQPGPLGRGGAIEEREGGPFPFPAAAGFHLPMDPSMAGAMPRREHCGQERLFAPPSQRQPGGPQHAEVPWGHGASVPGSSRPWERSHPMDPRGFPPPLLPPEDHQMQHQLTPMDVAMNYWEGGPGMPAWPSFKAPLPQQQQQQQRRHQLPPSPRMPPLMHPNARQHNRRFEHYLQMGGAAGGGGYEAHRQQQGGAALRSHPASSQWEMRGEVKTPRTPWGAGGSSDSGATTPWRAQDAMWPLGCAPPHHDHPNAHSHPHAGPNLYRRLSRGAMALPPGAPSGNFEQGPPPWAGGAGPWHHEPLQHPEPVHGTVITEEVDSRPKPPASGAGAASAGGPQVSAAAAAKASKLPVEKKLRREKGPEKGPDAVQADEAAEAAAAAAAAMPAPAEVRGRLLPREQMEWWVDPEQQFFAEQGNAPHQHHHPGLPHSRLQHRGPYQQGWPPAGRSCISAEGFGITGVGSCGGSVNTSPSVRAEIAGASTGEKLALSEGGEGATSAKANRARGRGRTSRSLRRGRGGPAGADKEAGRKRRRHERRQHQHQQQQHTKVMTSYEADESNLAASDRGSMSPVVRSPAYAIVGSARGGGSPVTEDGPSATQPKKPAGF